MWNEDNLLNAARTIAHESIAAHCNPFLRSFKPAFPDTLPSDKCSILSELFHSAALLRSSVRRSRCTRPLFEASDVGFLVAAPYIPIHVRITFHPQSCCRRFISGCSCIKLLPGCSRTQWALLASTKKISTTIRATWALPSRTGSEAKLPRGFSILLLVEDLDIQIQLEHTVAQWLRPRAVRKRRINCKALMNPQSVVMLWNSG